MVFSLPPFFSPHRQTRDELRLKPKRARKGDSSQPFSSAALTLIQRWGLSGRGEPRVKIIISMGDDACLHSTRAYRHVCVHVCENNEQKRQTCSQRETITFIRCTSVTHTQSNQKCWYFAFCWKVFKFIIVVDRHEHCKHSRKCWFDVPFKLVQGITFFGAFLLPQGNIYHKKQRKSNSPAGLFLLWWCTAVRSLTQLQTLSSVLSSLSQ